MIEIFQHLGQGFLVALTPLNLLYCLVGVIAGTIIGALPGIGPSAGVAILLSITFGVDPTTAMIMLAGIYYGAMYGGTITSVLINIPGESSSVMTTIDGFKVAKKGRAGAALGIAALGSFLAGTGGVVVFMFFAPWLAKMALSFGPQEFCVTPFATVAPYPPDRSRRFVDIYGHVLSDPTETTADTGVPGRGTEEAKTNDVTGRVRQGEFGLAIDMGRPGVGVCLRDVEKVAKAVCAAGLVLEPGEVSPLGKVLANLRTGEMLPEVRDKYLLSIIIEGKAPLGRFPAVIRALREVEGRVDTVFSVGLILRVDENGRHSLIESLPAYGLPEPIRGKVNVGLGRPLVLD